MVVDRDDEMLLINSDGIIIRIQAKDVSKLGRATQGVKIMKVSEDTNIIALAKVNEKDADAEDENSGSGEGGGKNDADQGDQLEMDT